MKLTKILSVLLVACLALCLCACGGDGEKTDSDAESSAAVCSEAESSSTESSEAVSDDAAAAAFTVKVVDADGNAIEGVMVQICKDACVPAKTDANGVATFNVEITDGYKLSVMSCPAGYEYTGDAEVYLDNGATEYTLTLNAVAENE